MQPVVSYTDYFVICTVQNPRQTKAIFDAVRDGLKRDEGLVPRRASGEKEASWILADYLDVVLHVFTPEARDYYRLKELWSDVPSVEVAARLAFSVRTTSYARSVLTTDQKVRSRRPRSSTRRRSLASLCSDRRRRNPP